MKAMIFREQHSQQMDRGQRCGIERDRAQLFQRSAMRENDAENRTVAGNGDVIDQHVARIAQDLEDRHERGVEFASREVARQRRGMIENDRAVVAVNQRTGVQILNATDAEFRERGPRGVVAAQFFHAQASSTPISCGSRQVEGMRRYKVSRCIGSRPLRGWPSPANASSDTSAFSPGHVEDFFLHDRAVQIVHAVVQRRARRAAGRRSPSSGQVIEVIEIDARHGEVLEFFERRRMADVLEFGARVFGFKGEWNEPGEAAGFDPAIHAAVADDPRGARKSRYVRRASWRCSAFPISCQVRWTSAHSSALSLPRQICSRTAGSKISAPPPVIAPNPRSAAIRASRGSVS
jgi:hypothetical protein